jgi:hypothetical protein
MSTFKKPEEPRSHEPMEPYTTEGIPAAIQTPCEPYESERSVATTTRTIRDGQLQGHPREMPGDRDSE